MALLDNKQTILSTRNDVSNAMGNVFVMHIDDRIQKHDQNALLSAGRSEKNQVRAMISNPSVELFPGIHKFYVLWSSAWTKTVFKIYKLQYE